MTTIALYLRGYPIGRPLNDGMSLAVGGLAGGLVENGADVRILCEGEERKSLLDPRGYVVECFDARGVRNPFALAAELRRYLVEALPVRRSLVVLNGMFSPRVSAVAGVLRGTGVPYVMAAHDPYDPVVFGTNRHLKWPYWYLFEKPMLARAGAVQVLDERHGASLLGLGVDRPLLVTENGVTPDRSAEERQLRWRTPGERVRLLYLGRYDIYNKGLDLLLSAFARLAPDADVDLTLQGTDQGEGRRLRRQALNLGVAERVRFIDPDYDRSPADIIGDYDIFCSPSRFEGFGLAALEAMLAARVLLMSDRAGIARHVDESGCGVLVPPTVDATVSGLRALLVERHRWREMGLAGRRHALARLNWTTIAGALLARYEQLLAR